MITCIIITVVFFAFTVLMWCTSDGDDDVIAVSGLPDYVPGSCMDGLEQLYYSGKDEQIKFEKAFQEYLAKEEK